MNAPAWSWLQNFIVKARKSDFISRRKHLIPSALRSVGWSIVKSRSVFWVMGSKVFIPPGDRNQASALDQYEPEVTGRLRQLAKEGMTFCDVGANIGLITLLASKLVGPSGRVIAFEPVPENAQILRGNVRRNNRGNITVLEKAVSSKPGQAHIHLSEFCGSHSLVANPNGASGRTLTVETVRLDSLPELRNLDILKIDAEGGEIDVLKSLGKVRPHHVILEYNQERCQAAGITWRSFHHSLLDLGFEALELSGPTGGWI